jgi:dienelactone hydrolase
MSQAEFPVKPIIAMAVAAAASLAALAAQAAPAPPSPVGDWQGVLGSGGRQVRTAVHVEQTAPGAFTGDLDLPDSGVWNAPLDAVTFKDGVFTFSYRGGTRRFEGRWDADAGAWVGRLQAPNGTVDATYRAGFLGLPVIRGLDGRWEGALGQGGDTRVVLRVTTDAHGTHALLDLPHALETDIPVTTLSRRGDTVTFAAPASGLGFEGRLDPRGRTLAGALGESAGALPLRLQHTASAGPRRPQTPHAPYPYRSEQVWIANPADPRVRLGCTLALPRGKGPHPVAYLLSGTGPQDRDETIVGHKPLLVLADHLARRGLGSLRCDDRGAGASTGDFRNATLEDFAGDAAAALAYLRSRPDVARDRLGLIGHSEGGIVAALAAAERPDVAFLVLLAGPGARVDALLVAQGEAVDRARGLDAATVARQSELRRAIYDTALKAESVEAARAAVEAMLVARGVPPEAARAEAALATRPDIFRILRVDPAVLLARVHAPVLALVGSRDTQVPPAQNLPALRAALVRNADATVLELPGLNHLLQPARTGAVGEYYWIEPTLAPRALDTITGWLARRGLVRRGG